MKLRDRPGENIYERFRESGMWMRSSLASGGKVMVNCWQGASRSATIVLAYLIQHHKLPLIDAIKMVKSKRDIRPNNGFLKQLLLLEVQLILGVCHIELFLFCIINNILGTNGNLLDLVGEKGQVLLEKSKEEGFSKFDKIEKHFSKQIWKSFCGVQSCCIALNGLECSPTGKYPEEPFLESDFWSYEMSSLLDESVVRKQGMTLDQCTSMLNNFAGITATGQRTDQATFEEFKEHVESVMASNQKQVSY